MTCFVLTIYVNSINFPKYGYTKSGHRGSRHQAAETSPANSGGQVGKRKILSGTDHRGGDRRKKYKVLKPVPYGE